MNTCGTCCKFKEDYTSLHEGFTPTSTVRVGECMNDIKIASATTNSTMCCEYWKSKFGKI